jgi:hypothetical protein
MRRWYETLQFGTVEGEIALAGPGCGWRIGPEKHQRPYTKTCEGMNVKHFNLFLILIGSLIGFENVAHAQFYYDNVTSDVGFNTGVGSFALDGERNPPGSYQCNSGGSICALYNTAVGNSALQSNVYGQNDTAVGANALISSNAADYNTAVGVSAMYGNTNGGNNVAIGVQALQASANGSDNTAVGFDALYANTANGATAIGFQAMNGNVDGGYNVALGYQALYTNTSAQYNTAAGYQSLYMNNGSFNAAFGTFALEENTSGGANTALGNSALVTNTTGGSNTAVGSNALYGAGSPAQPLMTGSYNAALGAGALSSVSSGSDNIGVGYDALQHDSTGSNNIAIGYQAELNVTTGSDNIIIGNAGTPTDNKLIRIGTEGTQKKALIAGIYSNTAVSGLAVVIGSNGELGAVSSSERFKTAIEPMAANTAKLQQLRPVTFRYKADPQRTLRYGLIAEEVAKVYPELVVRDQKGRIDGVRYDELAPMLLNEMQQEQATIAAQNQKIASLEQQLVGIQASLAKLQPKDELVAQR